jgi:ubiquinone/menaquinone biosynthesis C-methylase UbiE
VNKEKRDFDKEAGSWDEPRRARMANDIANAITGEIRVTPDMDVLDFGCGTGLLTLHFQPLARSVTGVDSSPGMLDILKAKIRDRNLANVEARQVDLDKGGVIDGRYHLIASSMTLHHIRDVQPLLDLFYRILAPGGYLGIADLDLDDGLFHGDNQDGVFHDGFDRAALRQMFAAAGFDDVTDRTATTVVRQVPGGTRPFTVFLITGRK